MISGVAIFIVLPLILGLLIHANMRVVLQAHLEEETAAYGEILGNLASQRLGSRLKELERIGRYLRDGKIVEANMGASVERLLDGVNHSSCGILRLDGSSVSGPALQPTEYPAIRNTFRGKSTVRYRQGEGLIFAVPIYNNGNVKYAFYELFNEGDLLRGFSEDCFDGQANIMLADSNQRIAMPVDGSSMRESDAFFSKPEVQDTLSALGDKLNLASSAASLCETDGEKFFIFAADMEQTDLYLVGIVPYDTVGGELGFLSGMDLMVFGLLLLLLAIGTFRIVRMDARARESDELREAKRVAEEASESKGRFLASMSHELRTPINTILGMNEMVLRETKESDTKERSIDIKSAAQILLGLINDVLDFSKIESGMLAIIPAEYDLTVLLRDLNLLSENRASSKSLDFNMEIQPDLPVGLYGDDIRIQQVLTNLLTNAVKYTHMGEVTLRMSGVLLEEDRIMLHCEVADTGIGIKPEDIEKLMELVPYTRMEESRNRAIEGSGLGLPIIINLLKLMDSELKVESVYGKGSTFSFDLEQKVINREPVGDIYKRLEEGAKEYEYRVSCVAPNARVLVVDDNSMNRKIFASLLKQTKIQVFTVSSGKKCLDIVCREHFDLIFMDHLMPEMDGVETLHRLRELPGNLCQNTPVIALTANAFSGAQEKYIAMGFDAFLAKPIITEKLEAMLQAMLPKELLEEVPESAPAKEPALSKLPPIEGVNWKFAKLYLNENELLWDTLQDFYASLDEEEQEISALFANLDTELDNYRTRVHALKSTSAMVGILSVSELARLIEGAAWDQNRTHIRALHPFLMEELAKTKERLRPHLEQEPEEKPHMALQQLSAMLMMLRVALDRMDIPSADAVMTQINSFSYDPPHQEEVEGLALMVSRLRFDEAIVEVDRMIGEVGEPE